MKKRYALAAAWLCLALALTGCWSRRELNDLSLVMGIGIDSAEHPGEIFVTAQIARPESLKSESSEGDRQNKAFWNVHSRGEDVGGALNDSMTLVSRDIYIGQNQVIVFGQTLAESGLKPHLDFFARNIEARMTEFVYVSRGTASETLEAESKVEKLPALNLMELLTEDSTSKIVQVRMIDFLSSYISSATSPVAPIVELVPSGDGSAAVINGTAVFRDDKMVGELDKTQTRGYLWAEGKVKKGVLNAPTPDGALCLDIISSKTKKAVEKTSDGFIIKLDIQAECSIGYQKGYTSVLLEENISMFQQSASEVIKAEINGALEKARSLRADIFGFGEDIHKHFPKDWEKIGGSWPDIFPGTEVMIDVKVKIRGTGSIINNVETDKEHEANG